MLSGGMLVSAFTPDVAVAMTAAVAMRAGDATMITVGMAEVETEATTG